MEDELKRLLPTLCRRLNAERLYNSLSGILPEFDDNIIQKKLGRSDQADATINKYIYSVLKKIKDTEHVIYFLEAVQEQFDLKSLGFTFMTPRQVEKPNQPVVPQQLYLSKMGRDPYPSHSAYTNHHTLYAPEKTFPSSGFRSAEGSYIHGRPSYDSGVDMKHPFKPSEPQNSNGVYPSVSHPGMYHAENFNATHSVGQQRRDNIMQDVVDNITCRKPAVSLPHYMHPHTRPSEQIEDRRGAASICFSQNTADDRSNTGSDSVRRGTKSIVQTTGGDQSSDNACQPVGTYVPNIMVSVDDNADSGLASIEGFKSEPDPCTRTDRPLSSQNPLSVGQKNKLINLSSNGSNDVNIQTDGDLTTADVQPEQPEPVTDDVDDDSGPERSPHPLHSAVPPQNTSAEMQTMSPTYIFNIARITVSGEGNHLDLGGNKNAKTVFISEIQRKENIPQHPYNDEQTACCPHPVEQCLESALNADPQTHNQCSPAQEPRDITRVFGHDENPVDLMGLPEDSRVSELSRAHISDRTIHNQTDRKLEYLQSEVCSSQLFQHSDTTQQPSAHLSVSSPRQQTYPKFGFNDGESPAERMEPPSASNSSFEYTVHQNTQPKVKRQNFTQTNHAECRRHKETYNRQLQQKDLKATEGNTRNRGQGQSISGGIPNPREVRNGEDESRRSRIPLTVTMFDDFRPLLGPNELHLVQDQRDESIQIPAHITLTPETSCCSGSE